MNNISRYGIARLNDDGSLDNTFDVGAGVNGAVQAIALQPDGKVIIGGPFNSYNGLDRRGLARVNVDGSLDTTRRVVPQRGKGGLSPGRRGGPRGERSSSRAGSPRRP